MLYINSPANVKCYLSSFHTLISSSDVTAALTLCRLSIHSVSFLFTHRKKSSIYVRRDLLESVGCASLFHSTNLQSGTSVQLADMKEEGKCCHSAT